jgi:DNA-binding CsgD family transcriptional regulator
MARAMNWARYDRLTAQGHSERDIADALGIPRTTLRRAIATRQGLPRRAESGRPPAPVQRPVQKNDTGAAHRVDIDAEQGIDTEAVRPWEPEFIRLWQAGATQAQIAQALGIPHGTVKSRAHTLQRQGKIQPRPRGGLLPVQKPVQKTDTGAGQDLDTGAVQRLERLEADMQGLTTLVKALVERLEHPPGPTPVQISALPPYPKGKAGRWNLWVLDKIREEIATLATERDMAPSQLVQEILWKALSERHRSAAP